MTAKTSAASAWRGMAEHASPSRQRIIAAGGAGLCALLAAPLLLTRLRERLHHRALAAGGRFLAVDGHDVYFSDDGTPSAPAVVLLHGFASSTFAWRRQRAALLEAGYRVVVIDQWGYGASARPAAPCYSTADHARCTLAVLDALGLARAHLVGHSYGGRIALLLAASAPERVASLALLAPEVFVSERPPIARVVALPLVGQALAYYTLAPALVGVGLRMVSAERAWLTPEVIAGYAAPLRVRGSVRAQVWQARSLKDGPQTVPDLLDRAVQPAAILWGEADPVFPVAEAYRLRAALPQAELRLLAGAGHLPHEERPDEVADTLLTFLRRVG
jgi:pimeloyl-ACP methyl ester carboxylesterase